MKLLHNFHRYLLRYPRIGFFCGSKSETNSNEQNSKRRRAPVLHSPILLSIQISCLLRISAFGFRICGVATLAICLALFGPWSLASADEKPAAIVAKPGLFQSLTEPPCSYCSTQHRKNLIAGDDRVLSWIRGAHNGGAISLRHFLSAPRVINDTYGLFFYDPDGGYVAAYKKDYGYEFYGWRRGVMVIRGRDGTLWSALTGVAIDGPQKGKQLERIPSLVTDWSYWLMLHPESTAYDLFDGQRYPVQALPTAMTKEVVDMLGEVDSRLPPRTNVLGVEVGTARKTYPLDDAQERACFVDEVGGQRIAVMWYAPTRTAVCFRGELDGQKLTFFADAISPESAPYKDRETGTRWTLAGRGIDGPLKGKELNWVTSIQCRWYAWAAENPGTDVYAPKSAK